MSLLGEVLPGILPSPQELRDGASPPHSHGTLRFHMTMVSSLPWVFRVGVCLIAVSPGQDPGTKWVHEGMNNSVQPWGGGGSKLLPKESLYAPERGIRLMCTCLHCEKVI